MVVVWAFASGGTGCPCRCGVRRGLNPVRHLFAPPLWCVEGWLNPGGTG